MPDFLRSVFGWGADLLAYAFTLVGYGIIGLVFLSALLAGTKSWWGQKFDWKWNPKNLYDLQKKVQQHNRENPQRPRRAPKEIKWARARTQQYVAFRLAIPMGLIMLAALAYHALVSFTMATYITGIFLWFLSRPFQYALSMKVSMDLNRQRYLDGREHPEEFGTGFFVGHTTRQVLAARVRWAFRTPASEKRQVVIVYRNKWFMWLNSVASWVVNTAKFGWLWHIGAVFALAVHFAAATFWPITMVCSFFWHIYFASEKRPSPLGNDPYGIRPWWVNGSTSSPLAAPKHQKPKENPEEPSDTHADNTDRALKALRTDAGPETWERQMGRHS